MKACVGLRNLILNVNWCVGSRSLCQVVVCLIVCLCLHDMDIDRVLTPLKSSLVNICVESHGPHVVRHTRGMKWLSALSCVLTAWGNTGPCSHARHFGTQDFACFFFLITASLSSTSFSSLLCVEMFVHEPLYRTVPSVLHQSDGVCIMMSQ